MGASQAKGEKSSPGRDEEADIGLSPIKIHVAMSMEKSSSDTVSMSNAKSVSVDLPAR